MTKQSCIRFYTSHARARAHVLDADVRTGKTVLKIIRIRDAVARRERKKKRRKISDGILLSAHARFRDPITNRPARGHRSSGPCVRILQYYVHIVHITKPS